MFATFFNKINTLELKLMAVVEELTEKAVNSVDLHTVKYKNNDIHYNVGDVLISFWASADSYSDDLIKFQYMVHTPEFVLKWTYEIDINNGGMFTLNTTVTKSLTQEILDHIMLMLALANQSSVELKISDLEDDEEEE